VVAACCSTSPASRRRHAQDGEGISNGDLDACAEAQKVAIRKGDFVLCHGQMEACNKRGEWGGYAAATAGPSSSRAGYWLQDKQVAGECSDTWGVECGPTRPGRQPPGTGSYPAMGSTWARFRPEGAAGGLRQDKVYEFFFCGAALVIPGARARPSIRSHQVAIE